MATRAYRRDSHGKFAGANGGTKVTYGKAGGFANSAFRARVSAGRGQSKGAAAPPKSTGRKAGGRGAFPLNTRRRAAANAFVKKGGLVVVGAAAVGGGVYAANRLARPGALSSSRGGAATGISPSGVKRTLTKNSPRSEAIPMVGGRAGVSIRDAVRAQAAAQVKVQPNYSSVKGTREYVGRRVTDGNYGLKLSTKPRR